MGINLVLNGYEWVPMATIICSCIVYIWRWRYFWRLCDDLLTWNPLIYFLTSRHEVVNPDDMAMCLLPSGKLTWLWKMAHLWLIYLIKMVIFHSHVSLPEGNPDDMAMFFFWKSSTEMGLTWFRSFPIRLDCGTEKIFGRWWQSFPLRQSFCYHLGWHWLFNIAMENCLFIDGLPIKNGDFPWLC